MEQMGVGWVANGSTGFPGVPVATLTYATDIAPHLERGLRLRRLRMRRWQVLHPHDGYNDEDAYDPYGWAKTDQTVKLFFGVAAILGYAIGGEMVAWFKQRLLAR
jgi:hypothetical protein